MGAYIHFTEEQKQRANAVDLIEFLEMRGETLLPSGREKRLKSNYSITIRGNEWFDHATKEGGLAIDFVQIFYGISFPEAVTLLLNGEQGVPYPKAKAKTEARKPFKLPPRNNDMRRVFAYLIKHRLIDHEIVSFFAKERLIYESKELSKNQAREYHNAIFVGYDENRVPRHAHKRGLYTEGRGYRGNIESSHPCYTFHYLGSSERIYVFEAPIDLLSFLTIFKDLDWKKHSYIALCGLSEQALFKTLERVAKLSHVILCLDHDSAGLEACEQIGDRLNEKEVACSCMFPQNKDWNEDLKALRGLTALPAGEHPQYVLKNELCQEILQYVKQLEGNVCNHSDGEKYLLQAQKQIALQAEAMKKASAFFLCLAHKVYKQFGEQITAEELVQSMSQSFRAYQNRGRWRPELEDVKKMFLGITVPDGIITEAEKGHIAKGYESIALELLKDTIKKELTELDQTQAVILSTM